MSTTVTFADNVAEAPERHHTNYIRPCVSCRMLVNRRIQNDQGECIDDEPTGPSVGIVGSAATRVHDSCGFVDPIFIHGLEHTESWPDKETGQKRTKDAVVVEDRFDQVGVSLRYVSALIERVRRSAAAC